MRIGILGAGNLGTALARRLAARGHDILISFSRTPEGLAAAAARIGGGAHTGTPGDAARHGEVVILATPWAATLDVVGQLVDTLDGKVVWDSTNPFVPSMDELVIGTTTSAGEQVAAAAPGASVVKAIAPFAELLSAPSTLVDGRRPSVFVCGDDPAGRTLIAGLVRDIDADPVDAGPLKLARFTEPTGMLVTNLAYVRGLGAHIAVVLMRDEAPDQTDAPKS